MGALLNYVNTPLTIATGGSFTLAANYNITGAYIQAGSANCLTISAAASSTLAGCRATGSAFTLSTRAIAFSSSGTLTLNGIVATPGRPVGTTVANGAIAIESTSTTGTIAFTNAIIIGGNVDRSYGFNNNSSGLITIASSSLTAGSSNNASAVLNSSVFAWHYLIRTAAPVPGVFVLLSRLAPSASCDACVSHVFLTYFIRLSAKSSSANNANDEDDEGQQNLRTS
jgi:hypothetical protein